MKYSVPYILTFLSFTSYSYLIAVNSFIHKQLVQIYGITKVQIGFIYGLSGLGSTIGTLVFIYYTTSIKKKIVRYFTWGNISYTLSFIIIILVSLYFPYKILLYLVNFGIGYCRSFFFPSILMIIKHHKDIVSKHQKINQNNHKFLMTLWSASFDIGMGLGFFVSNFVQYSFGINWIWIIIIGIVFNIATSSLLHLKLKDYIDEKEETQKQSITSQDQIKDKENKNQQNQTSLKGFMALLNQFLPNKLFLVICPLLDIIHVSLSMVLPPYFHSYGYKGSQGHLLAMYSLFIVIGASLFGCVDFYINKTIFYFKKRSQQKKNMTIDQQSNDHANAKLLHLKPQHNDQQQHSQQLFPFTCTISIVGFTITILLILIDSLFQSDENNSQKQGSFLKQMVYMAFLGIFYGGPTKTYFAHSAISVMKDLEQRFKKNNRKKSQKQIKDENEQASFGLKIQQNGVQNATDIKNKRKQSKQYFLNGSLTQIGDAHLKNQKQNKNDQKMIKENFSIMGAYKNLFQQRLFQIASALITINCLLFHFGTIPFVILAMFFIQQARQIFLVFLLILSIILIVCDTMCSCYYYRQSKKKKYKSQCQLVSQSTIQSSLQRGII